MEQLVIHPVFVHFPIAFAVLEMITLIVAKRKNNPNYLQFAQFVFTCMLLSMPLALISGSIDAKGIKNILENEEIREHFIAAQAFFVFSIARFFHWRACNKKGCYPVALLIALSVLSTGLALLSGKLGGDLVYGEK